MPYQYTNRCGDVYFIQSKDRGEKRAYSAIRTLAKLDRFIVEVEADSIVVFLTDDADRGTRLNLLRSIAPMSADDAASTINLTRRWEHYTKMMRFVLVEHQSRLFNVERWRFVGSIDDWYFLHGSEPLQNLVKKFVPHMGKDSFFELS